MVPPVSRNEYPWHAPLASHHHHRWYRDLVELHDLTLSWLKEFRNEPETHVISRGLQAGMTAEELHLLDSLATRPLESLLNDTTPEAILNRLHHRIWAEQAYTLGSLLDRGRTDTARQSTMSILSQCSWRKGRATAEARWSSLPEADRGNLRNILSALSDAPLGTADVLVERFVPEHLRFQLRACPHQQTYVEVEAQADALCLLHSHWIRGFVYALNHRVSIREQLRGQPGAGARCAQDWTLNAETTGSPN